MKPSRRSFFFLQVPAIILICFAAVLVVHAQGAKQSTAESAIPDSDADHVKERSEWFFRGRLVRGKPSAELRRRAYSAKLQMRAQHSAALAANTRQWTGLALVGHMDAAGASAAGVRCQWQRHAGLSPGVGARDQRRD